MKVSIDMKRPDGSDLEVVERLNPAGTELAAIDDAGATWADYIAYVAEPDETGNFDMGVIADNIQSGIPVWFDFESLFDARLLSGDGATPWAIHVDRPEETTDDDFRLRYILAITSLRRWLGIPDTSEFSDVVPYTQYYLRVVVTIGSITDVRGENNGVLRLTKDAASVCDSAQFPTTTLVELAGIGATMGGVDDVAQALADAVAAIPGCEATVDGAAATMYFPLANPTNPDALAADCVCPAPDGLDISINLSPPTGGTFTATLDARTCGVTYP